MICRRKMFRRCTCFHTHNSACLQRANVGRHMERIRRNVPRGTRMLASTSTKTLSYTMEMEWWKSKNVKWLDLDCVPHKYCHAPPFFEMEILPTILKVRFWSSWEMESLFTGLSVQKHALISGQMSLLRMTGPKKSFEKFFLQRSFSPPGGVIFLFKASQQQMWLELFLSTSHMTTNHGRDVK